ncbi:MAG TPA: flagellin [Armatimonadota bacterium]|nr:flagellin [Armatimonadota bacterium]
MSLSINTNLGALSAHRFLTSSNISLAKSIERLSSGLRINTAADDAAGLVLSENLRTAISGLGVASKNTQDSINMMKTGEKSLDEIEVQLRNIRNLILHASNNSQNVSLKSADQAQIDQALSSINRIADQTEFAGMKLFSDDTAGNSINNRTFQIGANQAQTTTFSLSNKTYDGVALSANMHTNNILGIGSGNGTLAALESNASFQDFGTNATARGTAGNNSCLYIDAKVAGSSGNNIDVIIQADGPSHANTNITVAGNTITVHAKTNGASAITSTISDIVYAIRNDASANRLVNVNEFGAGGVASAETIDVGTDGAGAIAGADGTDTINVAWTHPDGTTNHFALSINNTDVGTTLDANWWNDGYRTVTNMVDAINAKLATVAYTTAADSTVDHLDDVMEAYVGNWSTVGFRLKDVAANAGEKSASSTLAITSGSPSTGTCFGVTGVSNSGAVGASSGNSIDVNTATTTAQFDTYLTQVDRALKMVNGVRVNMGAFQKNNLESALSSIAVARENLAASESDIRDTDMASEMVNFTRAQILMQAGQAMMAQANQVPQNILQMLR